MIRPPFQRIRCDDGRVVILKAERICEIDKRNAQVLDEAGDRYRKNALKYQLFDGNHKRIIAGILQEFGADKFTKTDVLTWCAFAGEDMSSEAISSALSQLQKDKRKPIRLITEKGPNARWQVQKQSLIAYFG